ncbi:BMQ_0737 family morphogenetic spore coat protein [Sutcliffiella rhizosphaerae]|uniref:SipL SPOCS domain-containing protein n=1 Tax=Sutcliffiella rhizosphaerae TaxID=2880967 RepID=A0ABM8YKK7_9BACI|nr:hypothetical protein [Sutcliffiella rhizosphaerae]CAG9620462.1 hypothetical protein BACCIP111883_01230 [Sutcliffiella rhizosphaerae]
MSHKETERVCIKTRKVYDWVTRQVDVSLKPICKNDLNGLFACDLDHDEDDNIADILCDKKLGPLSVKCFLSDEHGHKVDTLAHHHHRHHKGLVCKEIEQAGGRPDVEVEIEGNDVLLQRVKVLIKGFITVHIVDDRGHVVCCSAPIPFATVQTFLLCAPEGTELDCHITFFDCDANLIATPDLSQLDINLILCLDIQMEADVKLEIEARICRPREEIIEGLLCPTKEFPPQCPEIFPAHNKRR